MDLPPFVFVVILNAVKEHCILLLSVCVVALTGIFASVNFFFNKCTIHHTSPG